jgi:curved DNA-binding protein CbpA
VPAGIPDDFYERLGVPSNADSSQINEAALRIFRRIYAEVGESLGASASVENVRAKADEKFGPYQEAHAILSNPVERQNYDKAVNEKAETLMLRSQALIGLANATEPLTRQHYREALKLLDSLGDKQPGRTAQTPIGENTELRRKGAEELAKNDEQKGNRRGQSGPRNGV